VNLKRPRSVLADMRAQVIDALRGLASAGVLLSAVLHLDLYEQGFRHIATIGPLFLLSFTGGLVLGVTVVVWRLWLPALLAAGFGAVTVRASWISVVHDLFGVKEVSNGWAQILAETAEYAAVAFGLTAALLLWQRPRRQRAVHPPAGRVIQRATPRAGTGGHA
jgi:hypothetical protein